MRLGPRWLDAPPEHLVDTVRRVHNHLSSAIGKTNAAIGKTAANGADAVGIADDNGWL